MREHSNANKPFDPGKWPFFYGWMVLLWGTLGILMSIPGQTIGFSAFTESLLKALNANRDQLSLAYMAGTIGSSFMLPWVGKVYDKNGARKVALVAAISLGAVLAYLSQIDRIVHFIDNEPTMVLTFGCAFIGFLLLRFTGQGILTMVSRNMMMKWFDQRRGFATGFSNVFIALSFSSSPIVLNEMIINYGWRGAWVALAIIVGVIFPFIILIFFRNSPEESGLSPDGKYVMSERKKKYYFKVIKEFNLKETLKTYSFWVFALIMAMQGLYITGFTFHVVSIFNEAGMPRETAIHIFQPSAFLAVAITLAASSLSDYIPLKYLLYIKGTGACLGILGVIFLGQFDLAYYAIIIGNGIMMGLFSVMTTVTWPRYYGRAHLGAISGQATMLIVFGSALGPILFSQSLTLFDNYDTAGWVCFIIFLSLTIGAGWANNPQIKLSNTTKPQ